MQYQKMRNKFKIAAIVVLQIFSLAGCNDKTAEQNEKLNIILFVSDDPDEIYNLAGDPGYKSILDSFKNRIIQFQMDTKDPWIISWEHKNVFGNSGVNL